MELLDAWLQYDAHAAELHRKVAAQRQELRRLNRKQRHAAQLWALATRQANKSDIAAMRETQLWVADKLRKLEKLEPHAWDRATLRALYHALEDSPHLPKHVLTPRD